MERALYNGVLSGMALDGKSFFYVNPLEVVPEACHKDERKSHVKPVRQKWFGCACCPPNLARLISSVGSYAYTEREDTFFLHQYIGGDIQAKAGMVHVNSGFPWNGNVAVQIDRTETLYTLSFRIPGWCSRYQGELVLGNTKIDLGGTAQMLDVNASDMSMEGVTIWQARGYLYITKIWNAEDKVCLDFPMDVQILEADSRIRENIGKAAIARGPIVYCMEEADNGRDLHLLSIDVASVLEGRDISIIDSDISGIWIKKIMIPGMRRTPVYMDGMGAPYRMARRIERTRTQLAFVPYYTWANRGENEMRVWVELLRH